MRWPGMGDPNRRRKTIRFLIILLIIGVSVEDFVEYRGESEWVGIDSTPITFYIADHQDQFDTLEIIEL